MEEAENGVPLERRPACDNCKSRKIKILATEKRQRVLLSSKYDEAVQDVSRQLGDVKEMLQTLLLNRSPGPNSTAASTESTHHTPPPMIDEQVPSLTGANEGYISDPSFLSHAHLVENTLGTTFTAPDFTSPEPINTPSIISPQRVAQLLHEADAGIDALTPDSLAPKSPQPYESQVGDLPLPPIDLVLKILRMSKASKQRFFVDVPTFEEDEFIDLCRSVYFATEPVSIWKWICVNVGLYYIFLGASEPDCESIGTTVETLRFHNRSIKRNAETAMQSLRLCSEPSMESCRALVLLVSARAQVTQAQGVYGGLLDYSIVAGEIQQKLFSASALRAPQQTRIQYAKEFASRLLRIQEAVAADDPIWDKLFFAAGVLLDIKIILPPSSVQSHPLQCSDECVDAARTALSKVVDAGKLMLQKNPFGWSMFLNVILSLVPFAPFIVLAGNAIATSSSADLILLSSVLSVLEPPAADSLTARKVYDACERLNRIATTLVSSSNEASLHLKEYQEHTPNAGLSFNGPADESDIHSRALPGAFDYGFPMARQDWDSVMTGFESELGGYDSRALTNIMEPYIANSSW
ncbi:hypothetical protein Daesc_008230 [Daldinia eschscholtzii]|uniref:Transcription factor domain-containing protein n=1 Tax=Daldinia eschscholtzii TaxID=292717 RepID=A0AAX6MBZ4_9PEZI